MILHAGPPVEECARSDHPLVLRKRDTALADSLVEGLDGLEVAVDERLVDERPQVLGGLQLRTIGGLEHQADAVGHGEVLWTVPAGIVELQHDTLVGPGPDRLGEVAKHEFEQLLGDAVRDVPHRAASRRLDEARHIEPFEAMMTESDRPLADRRPHPAGNRLQADAMLVRRPDLDFCARMLAPLGGDGGAEFFLSRARSFGVAACGWRRRGCWTE